jgi:hypothetical protein
VPDVKLNVSFRKVGLKQTLPQRDNGLCGGHAASERKLKMINEADSTVSLSEGQKALSCGGRCRLAIPLRINN